MESRKLFALFLACGPLLLLTGCFDDDDVAATVPEIPQADPVGEVMVDECAVMAADLLTEINGWTQGNLGKERKSDPAWDDVCQCWYWDDVDGDPDANPAWGRSWYFWVSFLQNDVPQQEFEGADRIHANINYNYWDHRVGDDSDFTQRSLNSQLQLDATDFMSGIAAVTGSGSGYVQVYGTNGGNEFYFDAELGVEIALSIPLTGCPTGTMTFTADTSTLVITFNGTATASWVYTPNGNADLASDGTFPLGCTG